MASRREAVLGAVIAAHEVASVPSPNGQPATNKPTGLTVHRFPTRPLKKENFPAIAVFPERESVGEEASSKVVRTLEVALEIRVLAPADTAPSTAADPFSTWVEKALMADIQLGGVARSVSIIDYEIAAAEEDQIYVLATVRARITYSTHYQDPEQAG